MIDAPAFLRLLVAAEAALVGGLLAFVVAHAGWRRHRGRWDDRRLATPRAVVADAAVGGAGADRAAAALAALPRRLQLRVVGEVALHLSGVSRDRVRALAGASGLVRHAERLCRSRRWSARLRGARLLTLLDAGGDAVGRLVADREPAVRAQAIAWGAVAGAGRDDVVRAIVRRLDDADPLCRFAARDALQRLGPAAAGQLAEYLAGRSRPGTAAALGVAASAADPRFLGPALRCAERDDASVRERAMQLLGRLGGAEAVSALERSLSDGDARVRAAAARAAAHAGEWRLAARVAPLLRDRAWAVRRDAALALRSLGAPGAIFLRRALGDADPFAADMARMVLDLPAPPARRAS